MVVVIGLGAVLVLLVSGSGLRMGSRIGSNSPPPVVVVGSASVSLVTSSASVVVGSAVGLVVVCSRVVVVGSEVSVSEVSVEEGSRIGSRIGSKIGSKRPPPVVVVAGAVVVSSASVLVASSGAEVVPGRVLSSELVVVTSLVLVGSPVGSSVSDVASDVPVEVELGRLEPDVVVVSSSPPRRGSSPPISPGMTMPVGPIKMGSSVVSEGELSSSWGSGFKIWSMSPRVVVVSGAG